MKTLIVMVLIFLLGLGWVVYSIRESHQELDRTNARKQTWFDAHKCAREGYVSGRGNTPFRLYRCDDGRQYIWDDIPEAM